MQDSPKTAKETEQQPDDAFVPEENALEEERPGVPPSAGRDISRPAEAPSEEP